MLPFVMLNPSTADAEIDDPTIRRCMGFARREGYAGIVVGNAYALRATDPKVLFSDDDPIGPKNDNALWEIGVEAAANNVPIVCAWGAQDINRKREHCPSVETLLTCDGAKLICLGRTKAGAPRHPLYVARIQELTNFNGS